MHNKRVRRSGLTRTYHRTKKKLFTNFRTYLQFRSRYAGKITETIVHPPRIGAKGFGAIEVHINEF